MSACNWEDSNIDWEIIDNLWEDLSPCVAQIYGQIIEGAPAQQAYQNVVGKDKELHRKLVKVILILKGEKFEQEKEVDLRDHKVSASDIELLIEEYNKRKDNISVLAEDITIRQK